MRNVSINNLALDLGVCRCASLRRKSRWLGSRSYSWTCSCTLSISPAAVEVFAWGQSAMPAPPPTGLCLMGGSCSHRNLPLGARGSVMPLLTELQPTQSQGFAVRGRGTQKKNPWKTSRTAGRILLHSSQTGWHPNNALHPLTAAAGHDNTHAGQGWSRLEGSSGGMQWHPGVLLLALPKPLM